MSEGFRYSTVFKGLLHDVSRMPTIDNWHEYFLAIAFVVARKSKDPSTKTGAVVVRDARILTTGYNGFPMGCSDDPELYEDRTYKYANIAHADANAVFAAALQGVSLKGATMYITGPPCVACSQAIIQGGIELVVWPLHNKFDADADTNQRWQGSATGDSQAQKNFTDAGVKFYRWGGTP